MGQISYWCLTIWKPSQDIFIMIKVTFFIYFRSTTQHYDVLLPQRSVKISQVKVARLWTGHLVWKNNSSIELADFFSQDRKKLTLLSVITEILIDTVVSAKKVIKTLNNLFWENGSIDFRNFFLQLEESPLCCFQL